MPKKTNFTQTSSSSSSAQYSYTKGTKDNLEDISKQFSQTNKINESISKMMKEQIGLSKDFSAGLIAIYKILDRIEDKYKNVNKQKEKEKKLDKDLIEKKEKKEKIINKNIKAQSQFNKFFSKGIVGLHNFVKEKKKLIEGISLTTFLISSATATIKFQSNLDNSRRTLHLFEGDLLRTQNRIAAMGQNSYMTGTELSELATRMGEAGLQWDKLISVGNKKEAFSSLVGQYSFLTRTSSGEIIGLAQKLSGMLGEGAEEGLASVLSSVDKVRKALGMSTKDIETTLDLTSESLSKLYIVAGRTGNGIKSAFDSSVITKFAQSSAKLIAVFRGIGVSATETKRLISKLMDIKNLQQNMFAFNQGGIGIDEVLNGKFSQDPMKFLDMVKNISDKLQSLAPGMARQQYLTHLGSLGESDILMKMQTNPEKVYADMKKQLEKQNTINELTKNGQYSWSAVLQQFSKLKENFILILSPMIPPLVKFLGFLNKIIGGITKFFSSSAGSTFLKFGGGILMMGGLVAGAHSILSGALGILTRLIAGRSDPEWIGIIRAGTMGTNKVIGEVTKAVGPKGFLGKTWGKITSNPNLMRVGGIVGGAALFGGMTYRNYRAGTEVGRNGISSALLGTGVASGMAQYGGLGLAIGSAIMPGIGSLVGAGIGVGVGAITGAIGGHYQKQASLIQKASKETQNFIDGKFSSQEEKTQLEKIKLMELERINDRLREKQLELADKTNEKLDEIKDHTKTTAEKTKENVDEHKKANKQWDVIITDMTVGNLLNKGGVNSVVRGVADKTGQAMVAI